ncbi:hypothetical protein ABIB62_004476 [Mucilaginibacter sp. UYP25]|uniref:hypothetical protein n=1 Tax=unclassified Mucilaginibacter TaxID=2617802 RepID=UPI00339B7B52
MKGFINLTVHSVADYGLNLVTAAAPWLFDFSDSGSATLFIPLFIGVEQLNMVIFTNYKFGLWKVFPVQLHLIFDFICGFILFSAAYLFDSKEKPIGQRLSWVLQICF